MRQINKRVHQCRRQAWLDLPAHQANEASNGKDSSREALGGSPRAPERSELTIGIETQDIVRPLGIHRKSECLLEDHCV
jgi:hypothetical protein